MYSRRDFARLMLSGAAASQFAGSSVFAAPAPLPIQFGGVDLGVCLYNYRDLPRVSDQKTYIDTLIDACVRTGVGLVEINSNYTEPVVNLPFQGIARIQDARPNFNAQNPPAWAKLSPAELQAERDKIRQWRIRQPIAYFQDIGARFRAAGLKPFSYVMTFTPDMTEAEIDAIFKHAQALGVSVFSTNQTKVEMGPRLVPFADRYRMDMGFHNHAAVFNPNEVASVESFEKLFELSPRMKANLDTGHFVAGNNDVLDFMRKYKTRITHLHMKDRKKDNGANLPWGQGDTPLKEALLMIKAERLPIPAVVEYEYRGTRTSVEEVRACIDFMKATLTA